MNTVKRLAASERIIRYFAQQGVDDKQVKKCFARIRRRKAAIRRFSARAAQIDEKSALAGILKSEEGRAAVKKYLQSEEGRKLLGEAK